MKEPLPDWMERHLEQQAKYLEYLKSIDEPERTYQALEQMDPVAVQAKAAAGLPLNREEKIYEAIRQKVPYYMTLDGQMWTDSCGLMTPRWCPTLAHLPGVPPMPEMLDEQAARLRKAGLEHLIP